jgi:hypothetical protein
MADPAFINQLPLSSVQLNLLNATRIPVEFASGCLIDYHGKRILLTVAHATGNQGNWAVQVRYVPGQGMRRKERNNSDIGKRVQGRYRHFSGCCVTLPFLCRQLLKSWSSCRSILLL